MQCSVGTAEETAHSDDYACAGSASMKGDETSYVPCAIIHTHARKYERMHKHTHVLTVTHHEYRSHRGVPKLSPYGYGKLRVHVLKSMPFRKHVASTSSPAATCKQGAALTSPARHACGCARPSRTRFRPRNSKPLYDGPKT